MEDGSRTGEGRVQQSHIVSGGSDYLSGNHTSETFFASHFSPCRRSLYVLSLGLHSCLTVLVVEPSEAAMSIVLLIGRDLPRLSDANHGRDARHRKGAYALDTPTSPRCCVEPVSGSHEAQALLNVSSSINKNTEIRT